MDAFAFIGYRRPLDDRLVTQTITVYTDGACHGNPGPGGWGAPLRMLALSRPGLKAE